MFEALKNWLIEQELSETLAAYVSWIVLAAAVMIVAYVVNFIVKKILLKKREEICAAHAAESGRFGEPEEPSRRELK